LIKRLQNRAVDAQPTWLRRVALLCLLLVAFSGSAQAVHVHGQWLPHQQSQVDIAVDASQAPSEAATELVAEKPMRVAATADRVPDETWHFARFSRPPPLDIR